MATGRQRFGRPVFVGKSRRRSGFFIERDIYIIGDVSGDGNQITARRQLEPADDTAPADPLTEASPALADLELGLAGPREAT